MIRSALADVENALGHDNHSGLINHRDTESTEKNT